MDTDLAPIDIALHWPRIRRHLLLHRWPSAARALDALATSQLDVGGNPVQFGTKFWTELGLTPGQIGATTKALLELERRRVVSRQFGRGCIGHSWTLLPSVSHWRGMTVPGTGRGVEEAVRACDCRAPRAGIALLPGQRGALSRTKAVIRLPESDHLQRPGLLLVEERVAGARSAMLAQRPRLSLVEERDAGAAPGSLYLASEVSIDTSSKEAPSEEQRECFAVFSQTMDEQCGQRPYPGSRPEAALEELVRGMTPPEARAIASKCRGITGAQSGVELIRQAVVDHRTGPEKRRKWLAGRIARIFEIKADTDDDYYDPELAQLVAELEQLSPDRGSGHSPPPGIVPAEERNFEGHPCDIA
jgi:hypothetical protein